MRGVISICTNRLERNQERQRESSNMEYLKNVVLKVGVVTNIIKNKTVCYMLICSFYILTMRRERVLFQ